MILIKLGTTRVVLIFNNFVIKIPIIPVIYFIESIIRNLKKNNLDKKINDLKTTDGRYFLLRFFLRGFRANYIEWNYCFHNPYDKSIIPVYGIFYGLIIVQPKGHNFLTSGKAWKRKLKRLILSGVTDHDMLVAHNYSLWKGRIRLHDYGSKLTTTHLQNLLQDAH